MPIVTVVRKHPTFHPDVIAFVYRYISFIAKKPLRECHFW